MNAIAIVETEKQVEQIVCTCQSSGADITLLVMTPYAKHYCERNNIKYIDAHELVTKDQVDTYIKIADQRVVDAKDAINDFFKEAGNQHDFEFEIGNYCYFNIYIILGAFYYKSLLLDHILERCKPKEVVVFSSQSEANFLGYRPPIFNQWVTLLQGSDAENNFKLTIIDEISNSKNVKPVFLRLRLKKALQKLIFRSSLLSTLGALYKSKELSLHVLLRQVKAKRKLLFIGSLKNWAPVIPALNFKISVFRKTLENFNDQRPPLSKNDDLFSRLKTINTSIYNAEHILQRLSLLCSNMHNYATKNYRKLNRTINKYDIVCASVLGEPVQTFMMHLAKSNAIPTCMYQHGEMGSFPETLMSNTCELLYLDYYFCFGEGAQAKYEAKKEQFGLKNIFSVGSSYMQRLHLKNNKADYILYATGKYQLNTTVLDAGFDCDSRLYQSQINLFKYFDELRSKRNEKIIFKPNNTPGLNSLPFEYDPSYHDVSGDTFVELLESAKLVVLDAPATTCVEVCATNKPLFVLLNRVEWFDKPKALLQKRAVVCMTPDELVNAIDMYLTNGYYPADVNNRAYVEAYAVGSGESAINTIPRIINGIVDCDISELEKKIEESYV